jgi:hypothetical protein
MEFRARVAKVWNLALALILLGCAFYMAIMIVDEYRLTNAYLRSIDSTLKNGLRCPGGRA